MTPCNVILDITQSQSTTGPHRPQIFCPSLPRSVQNFCFQFRTMHGSVWLPNSTKLSSIQHALNSIHIFYFKCWSSPPSLSLPLSPSLSLSLSLSVSLSLPVSFFVVSILLRKDAYKQNAILSDASKELCQTFSSTSPPECMSVPGIQTWCAKYFKMPSILLCFEPPLSISSSANDLLHFFSFFTPPRGMHCICWRFSPHSRPPENITHVTLSNPVGNSVLGTCLSLLTIHNKIARKDASRWCQHSPPCCVFGKFADFSPLFSFC